MQLLLLLLLFHVIISSAAASTTSSLATDIAALLAFKNSSVDPLNNLASWSPTTSPCTSPWLGVSCSAPPSSPPRVTRLVLENLSLSAPAAAALPLLSPLSALRVLSLKSNSLSGPIAPAHLLSPLSSLRLLFLSHNLLTGPLPSSSLPNLTRLLRLDLSHNRLAGPIDAAALNALPRLITLRLDSNALTGPISGLNLPAIQQLNLSHNHLSGAIPSALSSFPASSFDGNPGLCGPPLPAGCKDAVSAAAPAFVVVSSSPGSKPYVSPARRPAGVGAGMSRAAVVAIVVGDFAVLAMVSGFLFCYFWKKFSRRSSSRMQESEKIVYSLSPYAAAAAAAGGGGGNGVGFERGKMVFFEGTRRFELEDLLRASAEMLGKGSYGTAYKAVLDDGSVVAVKRLREAPGDHGGGGGAMMARREFEGRMESIGRLRHPNVVALKAYYYARDEKLLVYEYMPGGSLFSLLHGNRGPGRTPLDWTIRIRIAAGAARGLAYIHHQHNNSSRSKMCHGNIKSTNILLHDKSLTPKLADSALSQLFPSSSSHHHHQGYRAPELVLDPRRAASQKSDVFAFGVVLLEILTGKAASEEASLPQWVQSVVREEWTSEVFDLELMRNKGCEEEMVGLLQLAMACVAAAPQQRPKIGQVLKMIEDIRGAGDAALTSPAYESYGEAESSPCVSDDTGTTATAGSQ